MPIVEYAQRKLHVEEVTCSEFNAERVRVTCLPRDDEGRTVRNDDRLLFWCHVEDAPAAGETVVITVERYNEEHHGTVD